MSPRAALAEALLIILATPATWPLALGAFLLRGGVLLVLLPIVVLPSPVSLGNAFGPALMTIVLSDMPVDLAVVGVLGVAVVVAWIVVGGLIAGTLEAEAARIVADHDDRRPRAVALDERRIAAAARRILATRLVTHVPTAIALAWGTARLVAVTYRELTSPSDVVNPIAIRVFRGAPEVLVVVGLLWVVGEVVGAVAARRVVLADDDIRQGLRHGLDAMLRQPLHVFLPFAVPVLALAAILLPAAAAASAAWATARVAMASPAGPLGGTLAVLVFVAVWLVGLLLIAVATAWRAAVWSVLERDRLSRRAANDSSTAA